MKLQLKIIISVIIVVLTVNVFFHYNYIRVEKNEAIKNLEMKIERTSELLNRVNSGPIFYYDTPLLETNIKSFFDDPEIKSIYVLESSGEIELFYDKNEIRNRDLIEVTTDISYQDSKIGQITTTYTKEVINRKLLESIKNIVISLVWTTVLISVILLFILGRIIRPIKELTDLSIQISNGNLEKEISIHSGDEIGILAENFMKMRNSIKEQIVSLSIENEERKRAEIALRQKTVELASTNEELTNHRNHLEEIVKQRTSELQESLDSLERTKDQLVESEKMASLGDLVAGVAHEINTPIGIGVTAASHLESETKAFAEVYKSGELSKSHFEKFISLAQESSGMILSNLIRAASLIQSFKRVAVDQSSEERRSFNLKDYIEEVILSVHSKFKHTNYIIEVNSDSEIIMDSYPGALSQIITNLLMNSLQHGFEGRNSGNIMISISEQNSKAVIIYQDTGVGIPQEIQKRIFDPFFTTKRGQGGSGLGMNIVYNLVTQTLKGNISCSSIIDEGTEFEIILPINI